MSNPDDTARLDRIKRDAGLVFQTIEQTTKLHKSGRRYAGPCPLHGGDSPNGFFLYESDGIWRWKCSTGNCGNGSILDFVMQRDGLASIWDAATYLDGIERQPWAGPVSRPAPVAPDPKTLAADAWQASEALDAEIPALGMTGRAWWRARGMSDQGMARFWLGIASRRVQGADQAWQTVPSATIPVFQDDQVVAIRHRLLTELIPGDKYRPHRPGMGLRLVNQDSLRAAPDDDVALLEGEIKCYVACDLGLDSLLPLIATTGGIGSWQARDAQGVPYADHWGPLLARFRRVYVLFDPEYTSRSVADATARRLFGRRGYPVYLPAKLDDLIVADREQALGQIIAALGRAQAVRS